MCQNSGNGCNRWFTTVYGMKIHLNKCLFLRKNKKACLAPAQRDTVPQSTIITQTSKVMDVTDESCSHSLHLASLAPISTEHVLEDDIESNSNPPDLDEENGFDSCMDFQLIEEEVEKTLGLVLAKVSRKAGRREVDRIIKSLLNPRFDVQRFGARCQSIKDCISLEEDIFKENIGRFGFKKLTISHLESNIAGDVYFRCPINVLKNQISGSYLHSTIVQNSQPTSEDTLSFSHPWHAGLGREAAAAIMRKVMSSDRENILWHDADNSDESSFPGLLQLYSDKSRTSLKTSAFEFYPLHLTMLNFTNEYRKQCITNGLTFVAFLPVKFNYVTESEGEEFDATRDAKVSILHEAIDRILLEIKSSAITGFECLDKEGNKLRCHPCITNYCCDIPEGKDIAPIKNGNRSLRNCHKCLAKTSDFDKYTKEPFRDGEESRKIIEEAIQLRDEGYRSRAEKKLEHYSLTSQVPSLLSFPFVGIHPVLDFHRLFCFEPLHNFHLGISKELKKCLSERLKSITLTSTCVPSRSGVIRNAPFRSLRMPILHGINGMLYHIQNSSNMKGLKAFFGSGGRGDISNGLYNEEGNLIGMLEGKDYRAVDMVSPFIGMFVDRCCGEVSSAVTTKVFTQYVDVMLTAMSYNSTPTWNEDKISKLEDDIKHFKDNVTSLYGSFQASGFCLEKLHLLDHIGDDIRRMGGLQYVDAGLFEFTHTLFKAAYHAGSKRRRTAMDEAVFAFMKEMWGTYGDKYDIHIHRPPTEGISNITQSLPIIGGNATVRKNGDVFRLNQFDNVRKYLSKAHEARRKGSKFDENRWMSVVKESPNVVQDLISDIGEAGCNELSKELWFYLLCKHNISKGHDPIVTRVKSGSVHGYLPPNLSSYDRRTNKIRINRNAVRQRQRFVSAKGFYSNPLLRQDSILIEAEEQRRSSKLTLWIAKVLGIFRVQCRSTIPSITPNRNDCNNSTDCIQRQLLFVKYYDAIPADDEIDKALKCVKLKWAQKPAQRSNSAVCTESGSDWYGLVEIECVRGVVHIVRGDYGIEGRGIRTDIEAIHQKDQIFYLNRFYHRSNN